MKLFKQYLDESKKTYDFRVKLANTKIDADVKSSIESALEAFDLDSIHGMKSLPIQNHPRDFPSHGPCEVNVFEITLNYPATDAQVHQSLVKHAKLIPSNLLVIPRNAPELIMRDEDFEKQQNDKKEALLNQKEMTTNTPEVPYGDEYNKKLLKSLPTRKFEFAKYGETKK
jgi:hypothetical protein